MTSDQKYKIRPNKRLGQNFLVDNDAIQKLIDAAELTKDDIVVEVGAGTGALTTELAKRAKKVIAVEKDRVLIPVLKENTAILKNLEILQGDILTLPISDMQYAIYKVVGNIPYYLTAPLIRKFLESENPPSRMVMMVQKEMAERICAEPPDMSILAVSVQVYARPEIVACVPRSSFWPQPHVDSAIVRIMDYESRIKNTEIFFKIVKAGFSSPRKQLINNLPHALDVERTEAEEWLLKCGIAPQRRAETLSVDEWKRVATTFLEIKN